MKTTVPPEPEITRQMSPSTSHRSADPERDYVGYGPMPPDVTWPGGRRVAVSVVLNIEEGAERSVARGDAADDLNGHWGTHTAHPEMRNLALESAFEYGSRAGIWRVLRILRRHEVRATAFACAVALEANPRVARALVADGHEIANHGNQWDEHAHLAPIRERQLVERSTRSLQRTTGERPRCWYSRDGITAETRRIIRDAGYTYDSNDFSDDVPHAVDVDGARHMLVPYGSDTNDSSLMSTFRTGGAFTAYLRDTLEMLLVDPGQGPGMMTVALHPRVIGRPAYAGALDAFLADAATRPQVWFARRDEIARHWETVTA
jgi:peptidoglycan/xylan/chitin deacetylase (PgdA/CDA1 family)